MKKFIAVLVLLFALFVLFRLFFTALLSKPVIYEKPTEGDTATPLIDEPSYDVTNAKG